MMGRDDSGQEQFFYAFKLEDYVPEDHLLRSIDQFLDFSNLHDYLAPYYSHTGRPSIDPELLIRMLIIGYCFGIRSERRLCEEVSLNLAYRWFCRLGIEDKVPDHSTFSKNRHGRFRESDVFRYVFEQVLRRGIEEGLVGGEGFAVDASVVRADASRMYHHDEDDDDWGSGGSRAIREYLDALDEAEGQATVPKKISSTDPLASWTAAPGGPAFYAYSTNYLVDLKAGLVMDVDASAVNKVAEVTITQAMLERTEEKFDLKPKRLVGDTSYGTAAMLGWLVDEKGIEPHIPVWERWKRQDGTFERSEFPYDPTNDTYTCPGGRLLKRKRYKPRNGGTGITKANTLIYRSRVPECTNCSLKVRCYPKTPSRKVVRSIFENARDVARDIAKTNRYQQSRKDRKKVEVLFAHMKRILKMNRLRLRGLTEAKDEFLLTATVQNLRRMAKYLGTGPPRPLAGTVS